MRSFSKSSLYMNFVFYALMSIEIEVNIHNALK